MPHTLTSHDSHVSHPAPRTATKRKVAILREEFMALTHNPFIAILLNQLVYWSKRVKDVDAFLAEESKTSPTSHHGWFYKSATELANEIMVSLTSQTLRRYLKTLEQHGWISTRKNPDNKWDKTTQYRVNLKKIALEMKNLGHALDDDVEGLCSSSPISSQTPGFSTCMKNVSSNEQLSPIEPLTFHSSNPDQITLRKVKNVACNTEITTKITNKEHIPGDLSLFLKVWNKATGQSITLTKERAKMLHLLLRQHFDDDLTKWIAFCERIKASSFLMGQGPQKWRASFDWILNRDNCLKVLEGNFDDPKTFSLHDTPHSAARHVQDLSLFLPSIEDPLWKEWCHHLSTQFSLSPLDMKALKSSKFIEFDGRLIWIECATLQTLAHMEKLQFKLLLAAQQTFPKAWNFRMTLPSSSP